MAIQSRFLEQHNLHIETMWGDDGIVLRLPEAIDRVPVEELLIDPDEITEVLERLQQLPGHRRIDAIGDSGTPVADGVAGVVDHAPGGVGGGAIHICGARAQGRHHRGDTSAIAKSHFSHEVIGGEPAEEHPRAPDEER